MNDVTEYLPVLWRRQKLIVLQWFSYKVATFKSYDLMKRWQSSLPQPALFV
jgi:hypothetical protein